MRRPTRLRPPAPPFAVAALLPALALGAVAAQRAAGHAAPARTAAGVRELRVCADPNSLPYSNRRGEGFENRLAELIARDLGATVRYTWWAQRRGFVRNTIGARACDVMLGVPAGFEPLLTTRPYYRSTYVIVTRRGAPSVRSLDDTLLRHLRIGVQLIGDDGANTPPAHALARRGIVDNVVGFPVYGDYSTPNPTSRIMQAVAAGEVDVALVWGPLAGYFARREAVPLAITPLPGPSDAPGIPFAFDIAIGVRKGDTRLRDALQGVLDRRRAEVDRLLREYGVPRAEN